MAEIAQRYNRPRSALGEIFRVLRIGENVGVGIAKGWASMISQGIKRDGTGFFGTSKDVLEMLPPWAFILGGGHGFIEMKDAIKDDMTYEQWIEESQNPDSFLYRHKMPIGIAASLFGDPLTYMTFGVTGVSKSVVEQVLAKAWDDSFREADYLIATGQAKGSINKVVQAVHVDAGRPFTQGDALAQLRTADRARMGFGEGRLGLNVRGNLRGAFARGGSGVNFMGQQIVKPGLVEKITDKAPSVVSKRVTRQQLTHTFSPLIPDSKLLAISDDARRFVAMKYMRDAANSLATAKTAAAQSGAKIFEIDSALAQALVNSPSYTKRAEVAIRNIFGRDNRPPYAPIEARRGMLRPGYVPSGEYASRLKMMAVSAKGVRTSILKQATNDGLSDATIKGLERKWDDLVQKYDDPVQVVAEFNAFASSQLEIPKQIDKILNHPMFARISREEVTKSLDEAQDAYNIAGDKLFSARKSLKAAKTTQQKASRTRVVRNLEERYAAAKGAWETAKESYKLEVEEAGSRVVPSGEAWGSSIDETAVPFRWRGKTYHVAQPVADAIHDLRNPRYVDQELSRALKVINYPQNKWKILATSVNPSFHVMNFVGGMWNNMLGGIYNPGDYLSTVADVYRMRAAESGRRGLLDTVGGALGRPFTPGRLADVKEEVAEFQARHAGSTLVKEELGQKLKPSLQSLDKRGKARRAFTAARRAYGITSVAAMVAPDSWVPDDVQEYLNPLVGAGLLLPEIAKVGGIAANDVEETLRLTPFRVAARDKSYHQMMDAWSVRLPADYPAWAAETPWGKIPNAKETTWDIGASLANRFQFDYSKLTDTERRFAKTIFPFYTFYKNNFVLQVTENLKRPRFLEGFEALAQFSDYIADDDPANNAGFKDLLPEYFDKLSMFQIPVPNFIRKPLGLPDDEPLYLNPKLPFASLNLIPPLWQFANSNDMQPTGSKMLNMLAPIFGAVGPFAGGAPFKIGLEYSVGYQLGLARPIDFQRLQSGGWRQSSTEIPGYAQYLPGPLKDWFGIHRDPKTKRYMMNSSMRYVLDQLASPFITGFGAPMALENSANQELAAANTVSWLTGIRMTPVDPLRLQRGWLYRMESFLESQRGELKERGLKPTQDDQLFLQRIRAQLKVVERAWDKQNEEAFGNG